MLWTILFLSCFIIKISGVQEALFLVHGETGYVWTTRYDNQLVLAEMTGERNQQWQLHCLFQNMDTTRLLHFPNVSGSDVTTRGEDLYLTLTRDGFLKDEKSKLHVLVNGSKPHPGSTLIAGPMDLDSRNPNNQWIIEFN